MTHTKDEALKLALEALELHGKQYPHMVKGYCLDAITAIKQALAAPVQESDDLTIAYMSGLYDGKKHAAQPAPVQDIDWKDMYEKQKRRSEMWVAKYEKDIGPLEYAVPAAPVQPDWKSEYQKSVELHCITLDELREADAWIKNLEKLMADQDAMLERQTARIVDLQTHIENFDGEDR